MTSRIQARPAPVPLLAGIGEIAADYAGILSDIWGVVHNGVRANPDACQALARFRERGGSVVMISNAPRPHHAVRAQMDGLGVPRDAYDGIVTSGDITQERLRRQPGTGVFHLGPERDHVIFEGIDVNLVPPDAASLVVNSGLVDDETETPDDYRALLAALASRDVEMVCANPDIIVERGERMIWCAGALAEIYESLGGRVVWAGKPHLPIYERALARLDQAARTPIARRRVLAIGDSVRTDLAGAAAAGIDSLFVADGIHSAQTGRGEALDHAVLQELLDEAGARPRAVMTRLVW